LSGEFPFFVFSSVLVTIFPGFPQKKNLVPWNFFAHTIFVGIEIFSLKEFRWETWDPWSMYERQDLYKKIWLDSCKIAFFPTARSRPAWRPSILREKKWKNVKKLVLPGFLPLLFILSPKHVLERRRTHICSAKILCRIVANLK
jgi:hypothetical protein